MNWCTIKDLLGKNVLVEIHGHSNPFHEQVDDIDILQISPSSKYAKIRHRCIEKWVVVHEHAFEDETNNIWYEIKEVFN